MKNLVNGGFEGEIYPINPKAETILGKKAYNDIDDLPDGSTWPCSCIPAKFVVDAIAKVGDKGIAAAVLIPSGFAETGEEELQQQLQETAREHGVRFIGPNIYGIYYLPENMSAAFTTPYDVEGSTALASQSGGIGMGILGFAARPSSASPRSSASATRPTSTRTTCSRSSSRTTARSASRCTWRTSRTAAFVGRPALLRRSRSWS